jgi:hypothetical protein
VHALLLAGEQLVNHMVRLQPKPDAVIHFAAVAYVGACVLHTCTCFLSVLYATAALPNFNHAPPNAILALAASHASRSCTRSRIYGRPSLVSELTAVGGDIYAGGLSC